MTEGASLLFPVYHGGRHDSGASGSTLRRGESAAAAAAAAGPGADVVEMRVDFVGISVKLETQHTLPGREWQGGLHGEVSGGVFPSARADPRLPSVLDASNSLVESVAAAVDLISGALGWFVLDKFGSAGLLAHRHRRRTHSLDIAGTDIAGARIASALA